MIPAAPPRLDITIPAYNVGANIPQTLQIARGVVVGAPRFELGTPSPPGRGCA
jgi:hypothetical protein